MNALTAARLDTDNDIQFFNFKNNDVRTYTESNNIYFCLKDVCEILDIKNHKDCKSRLKKDGVVTTDLIDSLGRNQQATFINESNLYKVIFQSRKPEAETFTEWVTSEVLPSIRKNGMYAKDELLDNPDLLLEIITKLKEERERNRELKRDNEEYKTQLEYSKEWYSIKRVAKKNEVSHKTFNWRKLKAKSEELGFEVKKIFDANYGEVNCYHEEAWLALYPDYEL